MERAGFSSCLSTLQLVLMQFKELLELQLEAYSDIAGFILDRGSFISMTVCARLFLRSRRYAWEVVGTSERSLWTIR